MSVIRVIGDSMEPTLGSGDIVLIDHIAPEIMWIPTAELMPSWFEKK